MAENQNGIPDGTPDILARAGATLEAFQAFAGAAVRFYGSPIRQELFSTDLIRIEAPAGEPDLRYACWADLGPPRTALFFFDSVEAWENDGGEEPEDEEEGLWRAAFEPHPFIDPRFQQLWDVHGSPRTPDGLCPGLFLSRIQRNEEDEVELEEILADSSRLLFVAALLTALADTAVEELDTGRWEKTVRTSEGESRFVLSLPGLVDPAPSGKLPEQQPGDPRDPRLHERSLRDLHRHLGEQGFASLDEVRRLLATVDSLDQIPHPEPATAQERAQELVDEALESRGRRRAFLARRALEIWPDCVEAYVLMAEVRGNPEAALGLYRQGAAAGERMLGSLLQEAAGELWTVLAARPYLRALKGQALTLFDLGRLEESAQTARELLRLDALDAIGMRHLLIAIRLRQDRPAEAWELLDLQGEDGPWSCYTRALLTFGEQGDSEEARSWLRRGISLNAPTGLCLLERTAFPGQGSPQSMPPGIVTALGYRSLYLDAWKAEPGALPWLGSLLFAPPKQPKSRKPKRQGKPKRRR